MPNLHHTAMLRGQRENAVRIRKARSDRLLDQHVDARGYQLLRSGAVMHRRHADRGSIDPGRCKAFRDRAKSWDAELRGRLGHSLPIGINDSGKLDSLARLLQFVVDTKMVAPKRTNSHNGNAEWTIQ
jgi:hypothetical protein